MIGAGSISFSLDLLMDLWLEKGLRKSSLRLMDIDAARLETLEKLIRRYREECDIDLDITFTQDRAEALRDAQYVICAVKVGGYGPLEAERAIAERHGYYRGIGDRVSCYYGGIGAFHQLDFFLSLARDMEKCCPAARLIQTANPVFEGTTLIQRMTSVPTVGVCHGHFGYRELCRAIGVAEDEVEVTIAGVNHCVWLTRFVKRSSGEDLYPRLDDWIARKAEAFWASPEFQDPEVAWRWEQLSPAAVEMYRYYGSFPIGDALRSAAPWWFHASLATKQRWYGKAGGFDSEIGWSQYLAEKARKLERITALAEDARVRVSDEMPVHASGEQHIGIIDSLENGTPRLMELNVRNDGLIDGISADAAVEVPAMVDRSGIRGVRVGAMPDKVMRHVIEPRVNRMEQVLRAFREGDRHGLLLTLMDDPRSVSLDAARGLIEELLAQPWNEKARQHYR